MGMCHPPDGVQDQGFESQVIAATNIAETSLTIEGTVYVIDCMFAKQTVSDFLPPILRALCP